MRCRTASRSFTIVVCTVVQTRFLRPCSLWQRPRLMSIYPRSVVRPETNGCYLTLGSKVETTHVVITVGICMKTKTTTSTIFNYLPSTGTTSTPVVSASGFSSPVLGGGSPRRPINNLRRSESPGPCTSRNLPVNNGYDCSAFWSSLDSLRLLSGLVHFFRITVEEHVDHHVPPVACAGDSPTKALHLPSKEPPEQAGRMATLVITRYGNIDEPKRSVCIADSDNRDIDIGGFADRLVVDAAVGDDDQPGLLE